MIVRNLGFQGKNGSPIPISFAYTSQGYMGSVWELRSQFLGGGGPELRVLTMVTVSGITKNPAESSPSNPDNTPSNQPQAQKVRT